MSNITDPDVQMLAQWSLSLSQDYLVADAAWAGSPFGWIKSRPSRQIGAIGEKLVAGFLATKGFDVVRSPDSGADRVINGVRAEIKLSTLWAGGKYTFQQLRDQDYSFAICLGISPFDAHCWIIPKSVIMTQWKAGDGVRSQHGGQVGVDTAWLSVIPGEIPDWLNRWGGRLSDSAALVTRITGKGPVK